MSLALTIFLGSEFHRLPVYLGMKQRLNCFIRVRSKKLDRSAEVAVVETPIEHLIGFNDPKSWSGAFYFKYGNLSCELVIDVVRYHLYLNIASSQSTSEHRLSI